MTPQCRFGDGDAVARFRLSRGCVCFPDDREQDLCCQHIARATPLGTLELIVEYVQGVLAWIRGRS